MRYILPVTLYLLLASAVLSLSGQLMTAPSNGQVGLGVAIALAFCYVSMAALGLWRKRGFR